MFNFVYICLVDVEEVIGSWMLVFVSCYGLIMLLLGCDFVGSRILGIDRYKVGKGVYIVYDVGKLWLILVSCGINFFYMVLVVEVLLENGILIWVISVLSLKYFDLQLEEYCDIIFLKDGILIVSVEEYVVIMWVRYIMVSIGMMSYGYFVFGFSNYKRFCLDKDGIMF